MNFSLPPTFNFTCPAIVLHILGIFQRKHHSWGSRISFLLYLMAQESFLNPPLCLKCGWCCLKVQINYDSWVLTVLSHMASVGKAKKGKPQNKSLLGEVYISNSTAHSKWVLSTIAMLQMHIWTLTVRCSWTNVIYRSLLKQVNYTIMEFLRWRTRV